MRKRIGINIVYGIGIGLFLCSFSEILLENILIGPGWSETTDVFDLYGMICWLLIFSPVWGINFIFLEEDMNLSDLVVARYRTAAKWWGQCILRCVIGNGCCYAALYITLAGLAGISGQMGKCCVMIILHGLLLLGVGVWIKIVTKRMMISAITLTSLEVCAKLLIVWHILVPKWSVFSWGMYCYHSVSYGDVGVCFPLAVVCEIAVFISCLMIPKISKKSLLERIRTKDGYTY